jgi:hypothetical protein
MQGHWKHVNAAVSLQLWAAIHDVEVAEVADVAVADVLSLEATA